MSACKIVTIKDKKKLYKNGEPANSIELIELEEIGNTIISEIDLYQVGDKALFIQPDYCIPDTPFFSEYHYPDGSKAKCKLGSNGRIKAIKFNFGLSNDSPGPVYSYGILMPFNELSISIGKAVTNEDKLDSSLGITKWSEPEEKGSNDANLNGDSSSFPSGFYKTDEENINNLWNTLKYPVKLIGTQKIDGSSITIYCKKDNKGNWKSGICSRTLEKKLTYRKVSGVRKATFLEWIKLKLFNIKLDLRIFEEVPSTSDFVVIGKSYLEKLESYCKANDVQYALRGELCGKGLRGSGNKNNPSVSDEPHIEFYAVDIIENGVARRTDEKLFAHVINSLTFKRCYPFFTGKFYSREEIQSQCEYYFNEMKNNKVLIEGIVLKTLDGKWSAKLMNLEYDSRK